MELNLAGAQPVDGADEKDAAANIREFVKAVVECGDDVVVGETEPDPDSNDGGRYGYRLPGPGDTSVHILMPGVALDVVRNVHDAETPCLGVNGNWWWWRSAVLQAWGALRADTSAAAT